MNSDMENFLCSQCGETLAILNAENIKICGGIAQLEAIKMQLLFALYSLFAECMQIIKISNFRR